MATVSVRGTSQCIDGFRNLMFKMREQGLKKATMDGAQVAKQAMEAGAPVGKYPKGRKSGAPGPIRSHIIVYTRKRNVEQQGEYISRLVGPSKESFYSYFIEAGWYPAGRRTVHWAKPGRWFEEGKWLADRRRRRISGQQAGHSQMGSLPSRFILGRHWAQKIFEGSADRITRSMRAAFEKVVSK